MVLFAFVFLIASLFAFDDVSIMSTMENDPSAIVNGNVNAITGDPYLFEEDLVIQGVEPIRISRYYIAEQEGRWQMTGDFAKASQTKEADYRWMVWESDAPPIIYKKMGNVKVGKEKLTRWEPSNLNKGFSNTSRGKISSRTNLRNNYVLFDDKFKYLTVHCADGTVRSYKKVHQVDGSYQLLSEHLPNGNWVLYNYEESHGKTRLASIRTTNPAKDKTFASAVFTYGDKTYSIQGSDGQSVRYFFQKEGLTGPLSAVDSSRAPFERLTYKEYSNKRGEEKRLEMISSPHPRFKLKFYTKDKETVAGKIVEMDDDWGYDQRRNKVKTVSVPIDLADDFQTSHTFLYDFDDKKNKVYDCDGNHTKYHFDDSFRLNKLERYSKDNALLNAELYYWGSVDNQYGSLISKTLLDDERRPVSSRLYSYDKRGNILEEKFLGNLSGKGGPISFDMYHRPVENGAEVLTRRYRYSSGEPNLLLEVQEESGLRVVYDYLPNTDLPASEIIYDRDKIKFRKFFEYNGDHILIREISDDGASPDKNDFSSVAVRTIRQITPLSFGPYIGMPHVIEEKYWEKGRENLLKKTVLHYGTAGQITKKEIYDAEGQYRYCTETAYDEKGRPVKQTDPIGQITTTTYDKCGNVASNSSSRLSSQFRYDPINRPIAVEKIGDDGTSETTLFSYDLKSNLRSEIDSFGSTISHVYDPLNRRIETHFPPIPSENGGLITPSIRQSYDSVGNVILHLDPDGIATKTSYNAYGKPLSITRPDGAREQYFYNREGNLVTSIDPLGVTTTYQTDFLGRIVKKTISSKGHVLFEESFEYRGNCLVAKVDAEGNRTTYTYDGAGRKLSEEFDEEKTLFEYDSLGRLRLTQIGHLCTIAEYDLLDRVIEERVESSSGTLLRKVRYEYDAAGNRSALIRSVAGKEAREELRYDSHDRLTKKINPLGIAETVSYSKSPNLKTHTDPMGLQTIETRDAMKRIAKIEKRNGKTLALQEIYHSPAGHPTLQIDTIFSPASSRQIRTHRTYDRCGRLATLIEADGAPEAKTTQYFYTARGELCQKIKSQRATLHYSYDDLGRLTTLMSMDQSVCHRMQYDRLGRLIEADGIKRIVDARGRLLSETFPQGHSIDFEYDIMGRRNSCSVPIADCLIEYEYDPLHLKSIHRKTLSNNPLYTHTYTSYDLSGNLLSETLIQDQGAVHYAIDPLSRRTKIDAPTFSQEILQFDSAGNILQMRIQNDTLAYTYDPLYQLTSETGHSYAYDSLNNRLQKDQEIYRFNALNEVVSHLAYDPFGNPIRCGDAHFIYDTLDRLIKIETPLLTQIFTYDCLHRCLSKTTHKDGAQKTSYFLYDHQNEIGSLDETLTVRELRILGSAPHAEIGAAIAIELGAIFINSSLGSGERGKIRSSRLPKAIVEDAIAEAEGRYDEAAAGRSPDEFMKVAELGSHILVPIHDLQGNVAALISDTPAFYRYTAFGEETLTGNPQNPWRFSSKRTDSETGLVNFGRRYYFPSLGRWLTPDPEGFHDGMNLYAYVHNDPLTHFDEYGLVTFDYRFGWVNCPWNSQYSWTRTMPLATHGISIPPSWGTKFPASNDARRAPSFYPLPKLSPHLYVDGMQNSRYDCWLGGRCLSRTFGGQANILPFHTESFGLFRDLFSVYQSKRDPNYSTFSTRRLNKELLANIHSMDALNDPRKLFVTSFSRGAAYLYHGTKEFTPEQRNRLIVTACGPTMILPRSLGFSVTNLVSEADWCSLWCNPGLSNHPERYQSYADVHILSQEGGVFTRGHYFKNRTYQVGIQDYTVPLYRKYGEIK